MALPPTYVKGGGGRPANPKAGGHYVPHQGGWVPSLGGILALGTYPQQFVPALGVTFVVYPTPRVGEPGPGGRGRGERLEIPGLESARRPACKARLALHPHLLRAPRGQGRARKAHHRD